MPKIRLGLNAWHLNKTHTGIGNYVFNLLKQLAHAHADMRIFVITPEALSPSLQSELQHFANVSVTVLQVPRWLTALRPGLGKVYFELFQIKRFCRIRKINVLHVPFPSLSADKKIATVETVHDTIPWTLADYRGKDPLSRWYNRATRRNLHNMDAIITVSKSSQNDLQSLAADLPPIYVSPNGLKKGFAQRIPADKARKTLTKYGIGEKVKFLFYFGGFDPRKNVDRLVNIFEKHFSNENLTLVLGGKKALNNGFYDSLDKHSAKNNILLTGMIDEQDLPAFFQQCEAFVSLTKAEGFNIPLMMAAASGQRALVSDIPVHREVAGKAAVFLDLKAKDSAIAKEIMRTLHAKSAVTNKAAFDWSKSAEITFTCYEKVLKSLQKQ